MEENKQTTALVLKDFSMDRIKKFEKIGVSENQLVTVLNKRKTAKIREWNGKSDYRWHKIQTALNLFSFNIGSKDKFQEQDFEIVRQHIKENFNHLSAEEIQEAFTLYVAQKLDFKDSFYGELSNLFISKVLNSFRDYQMKQIHDYNMKVKNAQKPQKEATSDEKKQITYEYITECFLKPYRRLKQGEQISFTKDIAVDLFWKFREMGVLKVTETQRKGFNKVAQMYKMEINSQQHKEKWCELTFIEWVNGAAQKNIDLENIIKLKFGL